MLPRPLAALSRASRHLRPLTTSSSSSSRRSYITTTTLTASTPQALFEAFQALPAPSSPPSATFFALSLHSASASALPAALFQRFPSASTIGCLSSPPASSLQQHSLSLAHFHDDAQHMHTVLRSAMRGRERAAVGRWRPLDEVPRSADEDSTVLEKAFADGDWSAVWGPEAAVLEGNTEQRGQGGSRGIEGLESVRLDKIDTFIVLSTPPPASTICQELASLAPQATMAGLIVPPTPFVTGLPFTLFRDGAALSEGALGIAVTSQASFSTSHSRLDVGWAGYERLGEVSEVSEAQGNMLLALSHPPTGKTYSSNPTQHLLALLRASESPDLSSGAVGKAWLGGKEKDFYLGFVETLKGGERLDRVVKILSGDPARGGMALDTQESVRVGERVMFLHRPSAPALPSFQPQPSTSSSVFYFESLTPSSPPPPLISSGEATVEQCVFRATSEEGFLFGRPGGATVADRGVPGGWARWSFDP